MYRVIRKSLRDLWPLWYSSRDGYAEREHVNRGTDTPNFSPTLEVLGSSFLLRLSWLLHSRVRKFRRDLRISLYIYIFIFIYIYIFIYLYEVWQESNETGPPPKKVLFIHQLQCAHLQITSLVPAHIFSSGSAIVSGIPVSQFVWCRLRPSLQTSECLLLTQNGVFQFRFNFLK
jgi:hypothetical protein